MVSAPTHEQYEAEKGSNAKTEFHMIEKRKTSERRKEDIIETDLESIFRLKAESSL